MKMCLHVGCFLTFNHAHRICTNKWIHPFWLILKFPFLFVFIMSKLLSEYELKKERILQIFINVYAEVRKIHWHSK